MIDPIHVLKDKLKEYQQQRAAHNKQAREQDAAYAGAIAAIEQTIEALKAGPHEEEEE